MKKLKYQRFALLGLLVLSGFAHKLLADSSAQPQRDDKLTLYRGVSLMDLTDPLAHAINTYVREQKDLALATTDSVSFHALNNQARTMIVDISGRDKAFGRTVKGARTGYGFIRAEIHFNDENHILGHKLLMSRDWVELHPHVTVSLSDRLAVVDDDESGFRRSFPIGVGAVDPVQFYPVTTLMTPVTEMSVLDKNNLDPHRFKPKYFRGKPFIPLNVPREVPQDGKTVRYRGSAIAFHIWQNNGFQRGFLSHGCMRLRTAELDELLNMVMGAKDVVPTVIRVEKVAGAEHPFPYYTEKFNTVKNFGSKERPAARKLPDLEMNYLTALSSVAGALPSFTAIRGVSIDPVVYGPSSGGLMEQDNLLRSKD